MARDRWSLSRAERRARRERVKRRQAWAEATQTSEVLTLNAHGRTIRLHDAQGKIPACWRAGKPYERPLLEHIYQQGLSGLAVDAGANIGNHTLWFAGICGLDVVAFEPIKHAELARNIEANDLSDKVQLEPVALGAADTTALHVGKGRLDPERGSLPVRTLDSFALEGVALIKADVEGMEAAVFRGGEKTIRRDRPVIFAEEWGQPEHEAIAGVLEPWGYEMTRAIRVGPETEMGQWEV